MSITAGVNRLQGKRRPQGQIVYRFQPERRFWQKVAVPVEPDGCALWLGKPNHDGYGSFKVKAGREVLAHRFAYEFLIGPIPVGMTLDHLCHTNDLSCFAGPECPHRLCVNVNHLEPVTWLENVRRSHGRMPRTTECRSGHPYTDETTKHVGRKRICLICKRAAEKAGYHRRKEASR